MPDFDDLLEENEESQAFDAELEPVPFEPTQDSNLVIVEPPIIAIARNRRKHELRELQEEPEPTERSD